MTLTLNHVRRGSGRPLLLVHGLGGGWRSWAPILDELAKRREVIAVDLPGFGETPALSGEVSIATLTDAVADFIREQGLEGVSTVGRSMGGRMVLFPDATLHWFERCGHFPQWDAPHEAIKLILDSTG